MTISKISTKDCSICYACYNACSQKCIEMQENYWGFSYPVINESKCTNCNLCEKVCPANKPKESASPLKTYGCKNKDEQIRLSSSSGGVFFNLGKVMIEEGGVVFGAMFDKNLNVVCSSTDNLTDLKKLQGSKYVQLDIGYSFKKVEAELKKGKKVLFTGCPCQIGGLKAFLRIDYENLYTVDFICHGSPSPLVFKEYIKFIEKTAGSKITKIEFRNKRLGWSSFSFVAEFENGKTFSEIFHENLYMRGFLRNFYEKEACHNCKFKNLTSGSDLTLSDFWGSKELYPEYDDDKGLSCLIIKTEKGLQLFDKVASQFEMFDIKYEDIRKGNKFISASAPVNPNKDSFFTDLYKSGIEKTMKKYLSDDIKTRIRKKIKKILIKYSIMRVKRC